MNRSYLLLGLSVLFLGSVASYGQQNKLPSEVQQIKQIFSSQIDCSTNTQDLHRAWCSVTQIGSQSVVLPKKLTSYVGLSVPLLKEDKQLKPVLLEKTHLAVLHLGPKTARVTYLNPYNDKESLQLASVIMQVVIILKQGSHQPIEIKSNLNGYLNSERAKTGYPLSLNKQSAGFSAKLPSLLYSVMTPSGLVYVLIETDPNKNSFISVFPAALLKVKS